MPDLYEDEGEDDDVLDEEGRTRLKLKVLSSLDIWSVSFTVLKIARHSVVCKITLTPVFS